MGRHFLYGKGFIIPEGKEQECIEFLQKTNYYKLSAYFLPFRKKDGTFFPDIKFSRIQRIYEFDSQLRALIFGIIEDIEVYLRTPAVRNKTFRNKIIRFQAG